MHSLRNTIGASIGTALEFYDYTLYGIFAVTFASIFFPDKDTAPFLSLLIYALSSFLRPFGGIVFGYISDTQGRKKALSISVLLMAISTLGMGLLPTYANAGIYAVSLLIFWRCLQGISAGGEYNNTTIYSFESNIKQPGLYSGIVVASVTIGTLIAMFLGSIILNSTYTFAWRIPFLLGGVAGLIGLYFRRLLSESPAFEEDNNSQILTQMAHLFKEFKLPLLKTILVGGFASALSLTIYHYVNIYLSSYIGFDGSKSALLSTVGISVCIIAIPLFGYLSDIINPHKIIFSAAMITFCLSYPIYILLSSGKIHNIILAQVVLSLLSSSMSASAHPLLIHLFPKKYRCLAISFGFTTGIAIFGGVTPLISNLFIKYTGSLLSPSFYLISISLVVILFLAPNMKWSNFRQSISSKYV